MTLNEIAQKLNLSASTISRALNHPGRVSPATRRKVLAAVEAYGYRPNAIARSLRQGRTRTIGVVVSDLENPFYSSIAKAIENTAARRGYSCIVCDADENAEKEAQALALLATLQASGVIHAFTGGDDLALTQLQDAGVPIIEIDRSSGLAGVDTVLLDNELGARLAGEHLVELGHRRIAVISGPLHLTTGRDRLLGFKEALGAAGAPLHPAYTKIGDFREASGYRTACDLLGLPAPPSAIFVANNEMMAGALVAIHERGLRIPRDLSLISFDDVRWAKYVDPPLTTIAQPVERMGRLAAELFFERLEGRTDPVVHVLPPALIRRASCAPPPPDS